MKSDDPQNLTRPAIDIYITLGLITFFAYYSLKFISPFISILLWAAIFAVSVYPFFKKLAQWFGGKEVLASIFIAVLGLTLFLAPTYFITQSAMESSRHVVENLKDGTVDIPPPQESIKDWPVVGEKLFGVWSEAHSNLQAAAEKYHSQIKNVAAKAVSIGTSIVSSALQCALSVIFASVFLIYTKPLSRGVNAIARRLAGSSNTDFVKMAVSTTRNVFKGIIGTAIIQGGAAAIGLFAVGMPLAGLWVIAVFATSLLQVAAVAIIPSIIYIWGIKSTTAALLFTVYMIPVLLSDNVLKPILMTKGLDTPMVVIFMGVIGGTLSLGILGLFIGPVILAVFYEMVRLWVKQIDA